MLSPMGDPPIPPWDVLEEADQLRCRVFDVTRRRMREHPVANEPSKEGDFFVIRAPDWVNVVALTADDQILLIEQWRHGVQHATLEIPGGMVDPGESPLDAARRELKEETGYEAEGWTELGAVEPNPAIQSNRCHTFLARGCRRVEVPTFDSNERIHTRTAPFSETDRLVAEGRITHALVVAALSFETLRRRRSTPPGR